MNDGVMLAQTVMQSKHTWEDQRTTAFEEPPKAPYQVVQGGAEAPPAPRRRPKLPSG